MVTVGEVIEESDVKDGGADDIVTPSLEVGDVITLSLEVGDVVTLSLEVGDVVTPSLVVVKIFLAISLVGKEVSDLAIDDGVVKTTFREAPRAVSRVDEDDAGGKTFGVVFGEGEVAITDLAFGM